MKSTGRPFVEIKQDAFIGVKILESERKDLESIAEMESTTLSKTVKIAIRQFISNWKKQNE